MSRPRSTHYATRAFDDIGLHGGRSPDPLINKVAVSSAIAYTRAQVGIVAHLVSCAVDIADGVPEIRFVGLPSSAVEKTRTRLRDAIVSSGIAFPSRRITVTVSPAGLTDYVTRFDLAIALGVLAANRDLQPSQLNNCEFVGALTTSGALRPVRGVLPTVIHAIKVGHRVIVPMGNSHEAALAASAKIYVATSLREVCDDLRGSSRLQLAAQAAQTLPPQSERDEKLDLGDVRGHAHARRALEVAAAGAHHTLLTGAPGSGKTMLATRLSSVLPPLESDEALELASIYSMAGLSLAARLPIDRVLRQPLNDTSTTTLICGKSEQRPGEVSLSHHGVLFLDDLPDFSKPVLEVLREPLEFGRITVARGTRQVAMPARFQLIATMTPCPCGFAGDPTGRCRCTPDAIAHYISQVSGQFHDRIDINLALPRVSQSELKPPKAAEGSRTVRERVIAARELQVERAGKPNAWLSIREVEQYCELATRDRSLLDRAVKELNLSARGYHSVLRVARTIADLSSASRIGATHLSEAIQYKGKQRSAV